MKKLPEQKSLNQMSLRIRDRIITNNTKDNNLSFKNKEDISKTASILEERVFGKDLKNVNVGTNPLPLKNITFRNEKDKEKEKEKLNRSMNNFFNFNLLKPKEDQNTTNPNKIDKRILKNHNRTLSLNDIQEHYINDENSPNFTKENDIKKNVTLNKVLNSGIVKIGDTYYRQILPKKEENSSNLVNNLDQILDKCELEVKNNPQYVVEYSREIIDYLQKTENINAPLPGYFNGFQKNINEKMRAILVDWLMDVHNKFNLLSETLYLTINIIDRYLSKAQIEGSKFQLLGVSAMLIASKYEEIYAPEIRDFIYVTNKSCTKEDIIAMESKILTALDFDILCSSPLRFLERYHFISGSSNVSLNDLNLKSFYLAQYLIELSLLEYKMLSYSASLKAASALYVARKIFKIDGPTTWTNSLQFHTNYKEKELQGCTKDMCTILELVPKISLKNCYKKFSSTKFLEISKLVHQKFSGTADKNGK